MILHGFVASSHVCLAKGFFVSAMPLFNIGALSGTGFGLFKQMQGSVAASAAGSDGKVMGQGPFGPKYYLQGALAGGICCSLTHGALTPVDVVKTRIQLDPVKYNQGFIGGFRQTIANEGAGALLTGLGPTAQGYFIQVISHGVPRLSPMPRIPCDVVFVHCSHLPASPLASRAFLEHLVQLFK